MRAESYKWAASSCAASTWVGADGFHLKVFLNPSAEACGEIGGFLGRSKAMWILASFKPAHFSSSIPKNTTSERPIVFLAYVRLANKTIHEKPWRLLHQMLCVEDREGYELVTVEEMC